MLAALGEFTTLTGAEQAGVRSSLDRDRTWALAGWVETMASVVVRRRDPDLVPLVLVGLSLTYGEQIDVRDSLVLYPLCTRARGWPEAIPPG